MFMFSQKPRVRRTSLVQIKAMQTAENLFLSLSVSLQIWTYFVWTISLNIEPQNFIFLPSGRSFLHQRMRLKEIYFHFKVELIRMRP